MNSSKDFHSAPEETIEKVDDMLLQDGPKNSVVTDKTIEKAGSREEIPSSAYIQGWRLHLITIAIFISLLVAHMEATIVSTSVIAITNDLGGFSKSVWIFTGFLLTYSGLVIIWAKLSDIYGRKPFILAALLIFTIFSGACGASQTMTQLIVFRCIQGIGASGIYGIAVIINMEMVPPVRYPQFIALMTVAITMAVTFGPLIGGAINNHTTWRWVFLLNVPLGAIAIAMLAILQPTVFPNELYLNPTKSRAFSIKSLERVDAFGATLLLGAGVTLIVGLQLAADRSSFSSAVVLALLIIASLMWLGFFGWSWFVTTKSQLPDPVFPWRFATSRVCAGMLLGTILIVCTIQIPQRFQTVNNDSAFKAGTRLIPFSMMAPVAAIIGTIMIGRTRIPPIYFLLAGGLFEVAGTVGLAMTPTTLKVWPAQYVFQVLAGTGVGLFTGTLTLICPFVVPKGDLGVGTAAVAQFKILGGMAVLAIVTSVMNRSIRNELLTILPVEEVGKVLKATKVLSNLSEDMQEQVRGIFGRGYNLQMKIIIGFAAAQVPATLLMWTKKPLMVDKKK
ncbi:MFS multidrug transporter-like protein [Rhexocercosporidium sp. MPI-PUGE-AT-0058]|nr:MFS multidrug transporter-like protein [Rhexocercosporidium sp. MPI-PUGE-AT-0058]